MDNAESTLGVDSRQHMVDTMDFTELLDLAKQASGATSDSDLSRKLGVSRQSVSNWRNSNKFPDTITCATIAGITGVPLAKVLGIVGEARATDQEEKAVWRKLAATAMALVIGVGLASPAHVQAGEKGIQAHTLYTLCEMAYQPSQLDLALDHLSPTIAPS